VNGGVEDRFRDTEFRPRISANRLQDTDFGTQTEVCVTWGAR